MHKVFNKMKIDIKKYTIYDLLFIFSPLIDLLTSLSILFFKINLTIGMVIRFIFLMYMIFLFLYKSKSEYKKLTIFFFIILLLFFLLHLSNMYYIKGQSILFSEIKNIIKKYYYSILVSLSLNYFYETKKSINNKILILISASYLLLIFIAVITNTSFMSYSSSKLGYIGWFYSPNEVSASLAILSPFVISAFFNSYKKLYLFLPFVCYIILMLSIGTKVPFLAMILSMLGFLLIEIIKLFFDKTKWRKRIKKIKVPILLPIIFSIFLLVMLYNSSFLKKNITFHKNTLIVSKENTNITGETEPLKKKDYLNLMFNGREIFNKSMFDMFVAAEYKEKFFGLGYVNIEDAPTISNNVVEIDYADIFFVYGIIGFILYFSFTIIMLFDIFIISIKNFKMIIFDNTIISYYLSVFLILGIALFAGRTFVAPSVSLYSATLISTLNYKICNNQTRTLMFKINNAFNKNKIKISVCVIILIVLIFILTLI